MQIILANLNAEMIGDKPRALLKFIDLTQQTYPLHLNYAEKLSKLEQVPRGARIPPAGTII